MSKQLAYCPARRLSQFSGNSSWKQKPLGKLCHLISDRAGTDPYTLMSVSSGVGLVSQIEKFGREIAGNQYGNYFVIRKGDFAYNKSSTKSDPEGFIGRLESHDSAAVPNSIFTCFRIADEEIHGPYLKQLFLANHHGKWLRRFIAVGARAHGSLSIDDSDLLAMPIPFPSLPEQAEIANCLSSIDRLIAAQDKKVDALKDHKNGLMQRLFPRTGEAQPLLRLPEFQNAGGWEIKRVDEQGSVLAGKALAVNAPGQLRPYLRTKNVLDGAIDLSDVLMMPMTDDEFRRFEILNGDVLLNEGQSLELVGRTSIYNGEFEGRCAMQNQLLRFRAFPLTCPQFAAQYFSRCQKDGTFADIATKTTSVAHLGSSRFSALKLSWPPSFSEQECIAKYIRSIESLITAETQTVEFLILHKRGLMQQLLPSLKAFK